MKFVVSIHQDEDGTYIAECPSIPGCVSQGQTEPEAEANIVDAIRECLAVRDRKSTRLNSSHLGISYAVFCLKKKKDRWQHGLNNCRRRALRGLDLLLVNR